MQKYFPFWTLRDKNNNKNIAKYQEHVKSIFDNYSMYQMQGGQTGFKDLIEKSKPNYKFYINSKIEYDGIYYEFTSRNKNNKNEMQSQLWFAKSINNLLNIFTFLEAIVEEDRDEIYFYCDEDGVDTFFYVKKIDNLNLRFIQITNNAEFSDNTQDNVFKIVQDVVFPIEEFVKLFYYKTMHTISDINKQETKSDFEKFKKGSYILNNLFGSIVNIKSKISSNLKQYLQENQMLSDYDDIMVFNDNFVILSEDFSVEYDGYTEKYGSYNCVSFDIGYKDYHTNGYYFSFLFEPKIKETESFLDNIKNNKIAFFSTVSKEVNYYDYSKIIITEPYNSDYIRFIIVDFDYLDLIPIGCACNILVEKEKVLSEFKREFEQLKNIYCKLYKNKKST